MLNARGSGIKCSDCKSHFCGYKKPLVMMFTLKRKPETEQKMMIFKQMETKGESKMMTARNAEET